jgi:tetratricopeptide (TPR) repeat protein
LVEARDQLQKSLAAFPDYAQALTLSGVLNLQDSKLDEACSDLEHAIKSDSSYGMAYTVLGATYNLMKRYDDSIRTLEHGVSLSPGMWQGYYELSKALLGKGQFDAALRQINRAAELGPQKYPAMHLVRAHAFLGLKDYQQAVAELEQVIVTDPSGAESAQARETLGQVKAFMASKTQ